MLWVRALSGRSSCHEGHYRCTGRQQGPGGMGRLIGRKMERPTL